MCMAQGDVPLVTKNKAFKSHQPPIAKKKVMQQMVVKDQCLIGRTRISDRVENGEP